ncbi:hypothetical protein DFH08DRAFT_938854 [Mycena albidolilacea]|uniref:Uncharacterized protein n=1 Tax=Mycena albidolilacea TaxID=1033008 RepID=A0AAD6ZTL0_9AGAR|nr:hypothetical protein DFH08DRAFT_938854 [Mycena albidolilacea]
MPSDVEYPTKLVIFNAFFVCACQFGPVSNVSMVIVIIARQRGAQITEAKLSVSAHVKRPSSARPDVSATLPGSLGIPRSNSPTSSVHSMGTVVSGIRPFARRIILGVKSCKDSEEGAKFGELGLQHIFPTNSPRYCSPPDTALLVHYHCPALRRGWDLRGRECAIECAVHLGRRFVTVPLPLRHCWWRWRMRRRRIGAASSAGERLISRFTSAGVPCLCDRVGRCGASAASAEMAAPTPPCIPAARCDDGDVYGVAYRDAVTTARGAHGKCGAAGWVWKPAPAEGEMRSDARMLGWWHHPHLQPSISDGGEGESNWGV